MLNLCTICENSDGNKSIILPFCGFVVCYEHIEYLAKKFKCPVCKTHEIDKDECLSMRNNLKKIDFIKQERLKEIGKNPETFINNIFTQLINDVDIKREKLMMMFEKQINDYSQQLINELQKHKKNLTAELKHKMEDFEENKDSIKALIECVENMKFYEGQDLITFKIADYFGRVNFAKLVNKDCCLVDIESFELKSKLKVKNNVKVKNIDQFETGEILVFGENYIIIINEEIRQILKEIKLYANVECARVFNNNEFLCGLKSGHVKIFNKNTSEIVSETEIPNNERVYALELWSNKVVVLSGCKIRVWDPSLNKWIFELSAIRCGSDILMINSNHLLIYEAKQIDVFDLSKKRSLKSIVDREIVDIDKINDEEFISVHGLGFYKIWCTKRLECKIKCDIQLWKIQNVIALPNYRFLIYSEEDGITLWIRNESVYSSQLKLDKSISSMMLLRSGQLAFFNYSSELHLLSQ
ncbi:unnamed protein product [Brachionus calyciflorus]|uniref:RING-type domain-containing protein n=1 Tax=Brachionus calyciflorus TaxID=104777 RepID=A0A814I8H8_9BILA|nr:unnamed protein product [Brachionus calyciflorus]